MCTVNSFVPSLKCCVLHPAGIPYCPPQTPHPIPATTGETTHGPERRKSAWGIVVLSLVVSLKMYLCVFVFFLSDTCDDEPQSPWCSRTIFVPPLPANGDHQDPTDCGPHDLAPVWWTCNFWVQSKKTRTKTEQTHTTKPHVSKPCFLLQGVTCAVLSHSVWNPAKT